MFRIDWSLINLSETTLDGLADLLVHEKAGTALSMLAYMVAALVPTKR